MHAPGSGPAGEVVEGGCQGGILEGVAIVQQVCRLDVLAVQDEVGLFAQYPAHQAARQGEPEFAVQDPGGGLGKVQLRGAFGGGEVPDAPGGNRRACAGIRPCR